MVHERLNATETKVQENELNMAAALSTFRIGAAVVTAGVGLVLYLSATQTTLGHSIYNLEKEFVFLNKAPKPL